ncbi:MAG TPA: transcription elongation factor GreA [Bacteroidetes bacterium]|nr:transcription elongation factor GreA [Bacteroidota bacterium]
MSNSQYFTKAGIEKLRAELQELKTDGRRKIAEAISEAREKGDLRENAEYDAAKHAQGLHELDIMKREAVLGNARIIDESQLDTSKALIMATVTVINLSNKKEMKYKLVSATEADFKTGKISVDSPVGAGLLGKTIGDIAEIKAPVGTMKFEVTGISYE